MSTLRHDPIQARARNTTRELLDAARELVNEIGIDAVTTGKVAERADVAIGTVYRYFPNRATLLNTLYPGRLEAMQHIADVAGLHRRTAVDVFAPNDGERAELAGLDVCAECYTVWGGSTGIAEYVELIENVPEPVVWPCRTALAAGYRTQNLAEMGL